MRGSSMQVAQQNLRQAVSFHSAGDIRKAQKLYKSVLKIIPKDANALNLLGMSYIQTSKPQKAVEILRKAVRAAPKAAQVQANLAQGMLVAEMPVASVLNAAEMALQLEPENVTARDVKGLALTKSGRFSEAETLFQRLSAEVPQDANFARKLGSALFHQKRYSEALQALERAVELDPDNPDNAIRYAQCLVLDGHPDRAAEMFRPVVRKFPKNGKVLHEYARILFHIARAHDALPFAEAAVADKPSDEVRELTLAGILLKLDRFDEAHKMLTRLDRQHRGLWPEAKFSLSTAKFALGDLTSAWTCYRARFDAEGSGVVRRIYDAHEWGGSTVDRLLVWADQGLGDTLQCAAMLPEFFDRAGKIVLEVEPRFVSFFQSALPDIQCRAFSTDAKTAGPKAGNDYDRVICLSDVPGLLRPTIENFSALQPDVYQIDQALACSYRSRIPGSDRKPVVGVSWRSQRLEAHRSRFYLTAEQLLPLLETDDAVFVNLQYTAAKSELEVLSSSGKASFHNLEDVDLLDDLTGAAALTAACDIVVSPNSSVADMAGMLGVPTLRFGGSTPKLLLGQMQPPWFPDVTFLQMDPADPHGDIVLRLKLALQEALSRKDPQEVNRRIGL
jgi:tetratricopeptide (TPR) repeat protein